MDQAAAAVPPSADRPATTRKSTLRPRRFGDRSSHRTTIPAPGAIGSIRPRPLSSWTTRHGSVVGAAVVLLLGLNNSRLCGSFCPCRVRRLGFVVTSPAPLQASRERTYKLHGHLSLFSVSPHRQSAVSTTLLTSKATTPFSMMDQKTTTNSTPASSSSLPESIVVDDMNNAKASPQNLAKIVTAEPSRSNDGSTDTNSRQKKVVAVVGSGAVGCFYGMRLWEAGHDVRFYVRGRDALTTVKDHGMTLESPDGNVRIPPDHIMAHGSPSEMASALAASSSSSSPESTSPAASASASFDWVIVALKSSSLECIPALLEPLLDPDRTRVLVIMNGLIEDDLIRLIKLHMNETTTAASVDGGGGDIEEEDDGVPLRCCQALYGGMAFLCSNRLSAGRIVHSYAGQLSVGVASSQNLRGGSPGTTSVAVAGTGPDPDRAAIEDLWRDVHPGVPLAWEPSLLAGRWRKNVWNLAFNGLSTALGGWTVDKIVTDPSLRRLASAIMDETIRAGNADLLQKHGHGKYVPLDPAFKKIMFDLTDSMGPYKTSTMLDLTNRRPMEVKYLFQVPVRRARELGVPVPHLETIVAQIEALQRLHGL